MLKIKKIRRCSLVQFVSCPRVARSYFLCDSISAAGTLTQDSLLLLPSHNTSCIFRESKIKKNRKLTDSYRRTANFPPFGFFTFNISLTIDRVCSWVISLRVLPFFSMHMVSHNTPCKFRELFLKCFPRDSNGWFPVSHAKI